jgi:hypothetical protein
MSMEELSTAHDDRMKAKKGDNPGISGNFLIPYVNVCSAWFREARKARPD